MRPRLLTHLQAFTWLALVLVIGVACDYVEDSVFEESAHSVSGDASEPPEADDVPIPATTLAGGSYGPAGVVSLSEAGPLVILKTIDLQETWSLHRLHPPPRFGSDPTAFDSAPPLRI
jgi:hypothetical protein